MVELQKIDSQAGSSQVAAGQSPDAGAIGGVGLATAATGIRTEAASEDQSAIARIGKETILTEMCGEIAIQSMREARIALRGVDRTWTRAEIGRFDGFDREPRLTDVSRPARLGRQRVVAAQKGAR